MRDPDRLFALLPALHRMRDADRGLALQGLLRLIGREADVLEDDLWALYDGWFIETCPDWAIPYIGELVGAAAAPGAPGLLPRRDVADTVRSRRRKGTLAVLEELARDAAGWPAHAVECFTLLAWAEHVNHLRGRPPATADVRDGRALEALDGPFDRIAHTPDVRRPDSELTPGRPNIPSALLFAWRLRAFTVTHCQAVCVEEVGPHRFTFSALGNDAPLFAVPREDADAAAVSTPAELPLPISRRALEERLPVDPDRDPPIASIASGDFYGLDRSIAIWAADWPERGAPQPVPRERIIPADLSAWSHRTPRGHIAVDPELGRFTFPARQLPRGSVHVSYAYGFSAAIGGGEYERRVIQPPGSVVFRVGGGRPGAEPTVLAALQRWRAAHPRPPSAVIEIIDSEVYTEPLDVTLEAGERLQIRAAPGARPVIRLLDYVVDRPDPLRVRGGRGATFTIDGLLVSGRGLVAEGPDPDEEGGEGEDLCEIVVRHCTLVPGWTLGGDCEPVRPAEPSISLLGTRARLRVEHSIVGSIVVVDRAGGAPVAIELSDSVLDATGHDCDSPECEALTAPDGLAARAVATFRRCTVFGRVHAHAIALAENSIFTGRVRVARRQVGCMRFCSVVAGSRTPPRHACQPDLAIAGLPAAERAAAAQAVRPRFTSTRYGTPTYARLADDAPREIREGADDESEMGVFHHLHEPQRAALLRRRLEEFTPAGMDTGLLWAD